MRMEQSRGCIFKLRDQPSDSSLSHRGYSTDTDKNLLEKNPDFAPSKGRCCWWSLSGAHGGIYNCFTPGMMSCETAHRGWCCCFCPFLQMLGNTWRFRCSHWDLEKRTQHPQRSPLAGEYPKSSHSKESFLPKTDTARRISSPNPNFGIYTLKYMDLYAL